MERNKRTPLAAVILAVCIGGMVTALLNGVVRPLPVVVAAVPIAPGTVLTADLLEVRTLPAGGVPSGAFRSAEELEGRVLAVGRVAGDLLTETVLGEVAGAGIPAELPPGCVAVAVKVDASSGVAGLLRPGQVVTVVGLLPPDLLGWNSTGLTLPEPPLSPAGGLLPTPDLTATPTPLPSPTPIAAPLARLALSGLRVLMVPQSFRYQEVPEGSGEEALFSSARAQLAGQEGGVVVLAVPVAPVEISPGFRASPAVLLSALDHYGELHLVLEGLEGVDLEETLTLNLGELYAELQQGGDR